MTNTPTPCTYCGTAYPTDDPRAVEVNMTRAAGWTPIPRTNQRAAACQPCLTPQAINARRQAQLDRVIEIINTNKGE